MKIKRVTAKLYKWTGPVLTTNTVFATPLSPIHSQSDSQAAFRFFSWLVVEVETDEGYIGYGNAGLSPDVTKAVIDSKLTPILLGENPLNTEYLFRKNVPLHGRIRQKGHRHRSDQRHRHRTLGY
jgi:L-rhamnonate dehydratase